MRKTIAFSCGLLLLFAMTGACGWSQSSQGKQTVTLPDGSRYQGDIVNNMFSGTGIYMYPNGDVYEGDFANNAMHGRGTFHFARGGTFAGEFQNNRLTKILEVSVPHVTLAGTITVEKPNEFLSLAVARAGQRIAAAVPFGVRLVDLTTGKMSTIQRDGYDIRSLRFSPDASTLFVLTGQGLSAYAAASGAVIKDGLYGDVKPVAFALSPDGKQLVLFGENGSIRMDASSLVKTSELKVPALYTVRGAQFDWLATGAIRVVVSGSLALLDPATGALKTSFAIPVGASVDSSPDGVTTVVGGGKAIVDQGVLGFYDARSGARALKADMKMDPISSVYLSPNQYAVLLIGDFEGSYLESGTKDDANLALVGGLKLYNIFQRSVAGVEGAKNQLLGIQRAALSPDARVLATAGSDGKILVYNVTW
jgi:WD40 repeat protein